MEVAGQHVSGEPRMRTAHIEEVIVQANHNLADPDSAPVRAFPELAALQPLGLDSNHKFVILRRQLEKFFAGQRGSLHPGKSEKWVEVLYSSLLLALIELTFVREREQTSAHLDRIFAWFAEKTRFTQHLPRVRKDAERLLVPAKTVQQDNSMQARRERLLLRKLDMVPPIEARSPSPCKTPLLPTVVDRSKSFMAVRREEPSKDLEPKCSEKVRDWQRRQISESRSRRINQKIVQEWSVRRAKREEQYSAKADFSAVRYRLASDRRRTDENSDSYVQTSPDHSSVERSEATYFDFRPKRESLRSLSSSPRRFGDARIQRLRLLSGLPLPTDTSVDRKDTPSSLSGYAQRQADTSPLALSAMLSSDSQEQQKCLRAVRRALVRAQVACSYRTLSTGLNRPEDSPLVSPSFLPRGDEYLLRNPFSKLGLKKKKGKKHRKK